MGNSSSNNVSGKKHILNIIDPAENLPKQYSSLVDSFKNIVTLVRKGLQNELEYILILIKKYNENANDVNDSFDRLIMLRIKGKEIENKLRYMTPLNKFHHEQVNATKVVIRKIRYRINKYKQILGNKLDIYKNNLPKQLVKGKHKGRFMAKSNNFKDLLKRINVLESKIKANKDNLPKNGIKMTNDYLTVMRKIMVHAFKHDRELTQSNRKILTDALSEQLDALTSISADKGNDQKYINDINQLKKAQLPSPNKSYKKPSTFKNVNQSKQQQYLIENVPRTINQRPNTQKSMNIPQLSRQGNNQKSMNTPQLSRQGSNQKSMNIPQLSRQGNNQNTRKSMNMPQMSKVGKYQDTLQPEYVNIFGRKQYTSNQRRTTNSARSYSKQRPRYMNIEERRIDARYEEKNKERAFQTKQLNNKYERARQNSKNKQSASAKNSQDSKNNIISKLQSGVIKADRNERISARKDNARFSTINQKSRSKLDTSRQISESQSLRSKDTLNKRLLDSQIASQKTMNTLAKSKLKSDSRASERSFRSQNFLNRRSLQSQIASQKSVNALAKSQLQNASRSSQRSFGLNKRSLESQISSQKSMDTREQTKLQNTSRASQRSYNLSKRKMDFRNKLQTEELSIQSKNSKSKRNRLNLQALNGSKQRKAIASRLNINTRKKEFEFKKVQNEYKAKLKESQPESKPSLFSRLTTKQNKVSFEVGYKIFKELKTGTPLEQLLNNIPTYYTEAQKASIRKSIIDADFEGLLRFIKSIKDFSVLQKLVENITFQSLPGFSRFADENRREYMKMIKNPLRKYIIKAYMKEKTLEMGKVAASLQPLNSQKQEQSLKIGANILWVGYETFKKMKDFNIPLQNSLNNSIPTYYLESQKASIRKSIIDADLNILLKFINLIKPSKLEEFVEVLSIESVPGLSRMADEDRSEYMRMIQNPLRKYIIKAYLNDKLPKEIGVEDLLFNKELVELEISNLSKHNQEILMISPFFMYKKSTYEKALIYQQKQLQKLEQIMGNTGIIGEKLETYLKELINTIRENHMKIAVLRTEIMQDKDLIGIMNRKKPQILEFKDKFNEYIYGNKATEDVPRFEMLQNLMELNSKLAPAPEYYKYELTEDEKKRYTYQLSMLKIIQTEKNINNVWITKLKALLESNQSGNQTSQPAKNDFNSLKKYITEFQSEIIAEISKFEKQAKIDLIKVEELQYNSKMVMIEIDVMHKYLKIFNNKGPGQKYMQMLRGYLKILNRLDIHMISKLDKNIFKQEFDYILAEMKPKYRELFEHRPDLTEDFVFLSCMIKRREIIIKARLKNHNIKIKSMAPKDMIRRMALKGILTNPNNSKGNPKSGNNNTKKISAILILLPEQRPKQKLQVLMKMNKKSKLLLFPMTPTLRKAYITFLPKTGTAHAFLSLTIGGVKRKMQILPEIKTVKIGLVTFKIPKRKTLKILPIRDIGVQPLVYLANGTQISMPIVKLPKSKKQMKLTQIPSPKGTRTYLHLGQGSKPILIPMVSTNKGKAVALVMLGQTALPVEKLQILRNFEYEKVAANARLAANQERNILAAKVAANARLAANKERNILAAKQAANARLAANKERNILAAKQAANEEVARIAREAAKFIASELTPLEKETKIKQFVTNYDERQTKLIELFSFTLKQNITETEETYMNFYGQFLDVYFHIHMKIYKTIRSNYETQAQLDQAKTQRDQIYKRIGTIFDITKFQKESNILKDDGLDRSEFIKIDKKLISRLLTFEEDLELVLFNYGIPGFNNTQLNNWIGIENNDIAKTGGFFIDSDQNFATSVKNIKDSTIKLTKLIQFRNRQQLFKLYEVVDQNHINLLFHMLANGQVEVSSHFIFMRKGKTLDKIVTEYNTRAPIQTTPVTNATKITDELKMKRTSRLTFITVSRRTTQNNKNKSNENKSPQIIKSGFKKGNKKKPRNESKLGITYKTKSR